MGVGREGSSVRTQVLPQSGPICYGHILCSRDSEAAADDAQDTINSKTIQSHGRALVQIVVIAIIMHLKLALNGVNNWSVATPLPGWD